jgi:glycosyltransferase involved in cell wall biosynthesis
VNNLGSLRKTTDSLPLCPAHDHNFYFVEKVIFLSQNNLYRGAIPPTPSGSSRPLWSVMIPTYNCASFLRETLYSVLAQDPGPELMQIEVVDDFSTRDDPAAVVADVGHGRVTFYRQPENVGHCRNFDTCLQHSRGRLIHLLHGDDCVRDGFYKKLECAFNEREDIGAAFCRYISMDEYGNWQTISPLEQPESGVIPDWLEKIATGQRLQPPSMVVRREVYERLGGFDRRISSYGEDWEMWVRIAAHYPVWYEVEPLALYRIHKSSLTGNTIRTGENARDLRQVMEINRAHLPEEHAQAWTNRAKFSFALACLRRARRMLDARDYRSSLAQTREALKTSRSASVIAQVVLLLARRIWRRFNDKRKGYAV